MQTDTKKCGKDLVHAAVTARLMRNTCSSYVKLTLIALDVIDCRYQARFCPICKSVCIAAAVRRRLFGRSFKTVVMMCF